MNSPNNVDHPYDQTGSLLILVRTLALILQEKEGIVVDVSQLPQEVQSWCQLKFNTSNTIIVYRENQQITIIKCENKKLKEGQILWVSEEK